MSTQGFTLMELLVCAVIASILLAIAVPQYERFTERTRIAEADAVIGAAIAAQDRLHLRTLHYTHAWHALDAAPMQVRAAKAKNDYANGIDNTVFYTRGGVLSGMPNKGFAISFETDATDRWFAVARRVGKGGFSYRLVRPFDSQYTTCVPDWNNERDLAVCMDYMGVQSQGELSGNPMIPVLPAAAR